MKKLCLGLLTLLLFNSTVFAQVENSTETQSIVQDSIEKKSEKKKPKRVSDFKFYGGISTSKIAVSNKNLESAYSTGYLLGLSYRRGRFGYWEVGVNYNNSVITLEGQNILEDNFQIRQLEIPLTAGINLLSATRRVLGVRLFGGVVPGYVISTTDNPFNIDEDDFNRFQFSGRAGVGVDVLFLFLEVGYQYGFIDVLESQSSNLNQFDFRLGFRF